MNPALTKSIGSALRSFGAKSAEPPLDAQLAGWRPWGIGPTYRGGVAAADGRKLSTLMGTYGGTQDSVIWVYACTTLVMSEMGSYPRELIDTETRMLVPDTRAPEDLITLLDQPNERMTWFDFMEYRTMDEELAGNSYWLLDQKNALGQPLSLERLRPEFTQIAVNSAGKIIGYMFHPPNFPMGVPYDKSDVMHFTRPNPNSEYYGMGTVEAIQRSLEADLASSEYITGFFSEGGKISGVLTTNTISEVQFERFKQQFYDEFANNPNSLGILIAEQGTNFEPISEVPQASGVIPIRSMTKDEILAGFGVPAPLLGGALLNSRQQIEQTQHILSRRMLPRAVRASARLTSDLTSKWGLSLRINVAFAEPRTQKVERAGAMLKGGATLNESRREMDLGPIDEPWANQPVVPQGFAPLGYMTAGGVPAVEPAAPAGPAPVNDPPGGMPEAALTAHLMEYLSEARDRVMTRAEDFADRHSAARFTRNQGKRPKDQMSVDALWDQPYELQSLAQLGLDIRHAVEVLSQIHDGLVAAIDEGKRRSYSVDQIVDGYPHEGYEGISGVFDDVEEWLPTMLEG